MRKILFSIVILVSYAECSLAVPQRYLSDNGLSICIDSTSIILGAPLRRYVEQASYKFTRPDYRIYPIAECTYLWTSDTTISVTSNLSVEDVAKSFSCTYRTDKQLKEIKSFGSRKSLRHASRIEFIPSSEFTYVTIYIDVNTKHGVVRDSMVYTPKHKTQVFKGWRLKNWYSITICSTSPHRFPLNACCTYTDSLSFQNEHKIHFNSNVMSISIPELYPSFFEQVHFRDEQMIVTEEKIVWCGQVFRRVYNNSNEVVDYNSKVKQVSLLMPQ